MKAEFTPLRRLHGPKSPVVLHTITAEEAGQRIDNFLMRHFKAVPRSRVYRLLRKGEVRVNRKRVDAEYRIAAGDEVRLPPVRIDERRGAGPPFRQSRGADRAGRDLSGQAPARDRQAGGCCGARRQRHELRRDRGAACFAAARDTRARASPRPRYQRLPAGRPRSGHADLAACA